MEKMNSEIGVLGYAKLNVENENAFGVDSDRVDGRNSDTRPDPLYFSGKPEGHPAGKDKVRQSKGEGKAGQKRICPAANGTKKNYKTQLEKVTIRLFQIPQVLLETFTLYFFLHQKYKGIVYAQRTTLARFKNCTSRTITDHLKKLCKLTVPGLPPLMQIRRGGSHRWYTESPFLDTVCRYALDRNINLKAYSEKQLMELINQIFITQLSTEKGEYPSYHESIKLETIQEPIPQNEGPIYLELNSILDKQQPTVPVPTPVPAPLPPTRKEPEPVVVPFEEKIEKPQEEKEHTLIVSEKLYAESLFSENKEAKSWIKRMCLRISTIINRALTHKLGARDLGNLLQYVYSRWLKGLIKSSPMAYILGTIPHYTPTPEVPDYQGEAAKKTVQENTQLCEQAQERKTRTAYLEERLASDPAFNHCRKIANAHYAPLSLLVEIWQDVTDHASEIPDAKVLEHLLDTALIENTEPYTFSNSFASMLKNYCSCKGLN